MNRIFLAMVGCALLVAGKSHAQEPGAEVDDAQGYVVIGLADSDLLNLRATASASGMLIARVPNGTLLRGHGCAEVSGNRWCKVSDIDNPSVMGWVAERYLQTSDADYAEPAAPPPVDETGDMIGPVEGETPPG